MLHGPHPAKILTVFLQCWRRDLLVFTDGKCCLDRGPIRHPLPPDCPEQRWMERAEGVRVSGPQRWILLQD